MIEVDPWSDVPIYQQIVEQVRLGVASGRLSPGDRLEPVRGLAGRLKVNASTVAHAYQLLERDGVIQTNRRGGSRIADRPDSASLHAARERRLRAVLERALVETLAQGYTPAEVQAAFELQMAAWRERRQPVPPGPVAPPTAARLARFVGSHDLALEALWAQARNSGPRCDFEVSYVGSLDGLLALLHGEAGLAGAHILDEETGQYNLPILRRLFFGQPLSVVTLAHREQGLIVPPGNPARVRDLADVAAHGLRFANRQPGSGTRSLLEHLLRRSTIPSERIQGFRSAAPTHLAVANAVASGEADVGLGLLAAARAYGLAFVPLAHERYDLVLRAEDRALAPLGPLLDLIRTPAYRAMVGGLGGYDTAHTGEEISLS